MTTLAEQGIEQFRRDLLQLHHYSGKPSPSEMATRSGRTPELFRFLGGSGLPRWDEVTALLTGTGNHGQADRWHRRWVRLGGQRRQALGQAGEPASADPPHQWPAEADRSGAEAAGSAPVPMHKAGPIALALAATTADEFGEALEQMRLVADISFAAIERIAQGSLSGSTANRMVHGFLPVRKQALDAFVRACGRADEEDQWWDCAQRVRRGDPPPFQAAAIPATELVRQGEERELPAAVVSTPKRTGYAKARADNARLQGEVRQLKAALANRDIMIDSLIRAFRSQEEARSEPELGRQVVPVPRPEMVPLAAASRKPAARRPVRQPVVRARVGQAYSRASGAFDEVNIA